MIYRKKYELGIVSIEECIGSKGTVKMEKLLCVPEEMMGKGGAYVCHTLNPGVFIGVYAHEGEMEIIAIINGKTMYTANGREQHPEAGDMITAQPGGTHGTAQEGTESLVFIAQVLYTQTREQRVQRKA